MSALQSLLERKTKSEVFEQRYITKSGQLIWATVATTLLRDDSDSPKYFITHIEDVTSRKLAEEQLKANEQKFRIFFEHVTDYSLVFEPSDKGPVIVDLNEAACENLGYSRQELIGQHISLLDKGVNFIQKPFSKKDLAVKVKEVLNSESL